MRYVVGSVFVLASVMSPLSASAQGGEESATPEPSAEEPAPSSEPALQLKLDEAGIQVMESPPPAVDGYPRRIQIIDERMDPRVKRARIGFLVSTGVFGAGMVLLMVASVGGVSTGIVQPVEDTSGDWVDPALVAGGVVAGAGVVGMITAGGIWGHRRRQLRKGLGNVSDSRTPRRVQWDLAQSRLVF